MLYVTLILRGVLSTKLMPVHFPSSTFLMNRAKGMATSLLTCGDIAVSYLLSAVYFSIMASKNLQKSSARQNNSVTLSSVIIAIIVCNSLYFNTIKVQQFSLITKFSSTYISSYSRYNYNEAIIILFQESVCLHGRPVVNGNGSGRR